MCRTSPKLAQHFTMRNLSLLLADADAYANLVRRQEDEKGNQFYLFEQSKHYGNGEDKK